MTKSLDESAGTNRANLHKGFIFLVCNFFGIYFLGIMTNVWAETPIIQVVKNRL